MLFRGAGNETVAPAKTGGAVDAYRLRRSAHGARVQQVLQVGQPAFTLAQAEIGSLN